MNGTFDLVPGIPMNTNTDTRRTHPHANRRIVIQSEWVLLDYFNIASILGIILSSAERPVLECCSTHCIPCCSQQD